MHIFSEKLIWLGQVYKILFCIPYSVLKILNIKVPLFLYCPFPLLRNLSCEMHMSMMGLFKVSIALNNFQQWNTLIIKLDLLCCIIKIFCMNKYNPSVVIRIHALSLVIWKFQFIERSLNKFR